MKYKKLLVLITCLLFVTVAVFCFASAFKITDIELSVTTVNGSQEGVDALSENYLQKYENKNLIFVKTDEIERDLSSLSGYIEVVSVKKAYPNKISVVIKERAECFSIYHGGKYYALDGNFNVLSKKDTNANNLGGSSNLLLKLSSSDYSSDIEIGRPLNLYDTTLKEMMNSASSKIYSFRENLSFVQFLVKQDGVSNRVITLVMKEGVTFKVLKANERTVDKLTATFNYYLALENKGVGEYVTVLGDDGNISIRE